MLVLSRKENQSIDLYHRKTGVFLARITLSEIRREGCAAIGIDSREDILILRSELVTGRIEPDGCSTRSRGEVG